MSVRARAAIGGLLALMAALFAPTPAGAYCRTTTCDPSIDSCEFDRNLCNISGDVLHWPSACVTFSVEAQGSTRHTISADAAEAVAGRAFGSWLRADCGGAPPTIAVEPTERATCTEPQYNQDAGNANVVIFQDQLWPANSEHALALTTVWFNPENGRIYDVDVEVNGTAGAITITTPEAGADLQSILTHEFGHFLGLSHSEDRSAVMRRVYDSGNDDLRALSADDVEGICALYPLTRSITSSECTPRHGFASACASDDSRACAVGPAVGRGSGPLFALGVALSALFAAGRRARRKRARATQVGVSGGPST